MIVIWSEWKMSTNCFIFRLRKGLCDEHASFFKFPEEWFENSVWSSFVIVVEPAFCKLFVLSQIDFFETFRIYNIPHNYGIPQVMVHSRANLSLLLPSPRGVVLFPLWIVDRSNYTESCQFTSEICFARGKERMQFRLINWFITVKCVCYECLLSAYICTGVVSIGKSWFRS